MVTGTMQVLQDALVSSSWSVEAAMALLCEGNSVGDKKHSANVLSRKKRSTNVLSRKKGNTSDVNKLILELTTQDIYIEPDLNF
jgi:hypothetical protein